MIAKRYPYELVLIMPVYNEEECISYVVQSWVDELISAEIRYKMIVINDGSRDNTGEILDNFRYNTQIDVITKANSGHGPTILEGYKLAIDLAPWIFQTDSDNEVKPCHFTELWKRRDDYDALFGIRQNRIQTVWHKIISGLSRFVVHSLFGNGVVDVNVPFRLMQVSALKEILPDIPDNTFAPNVIISGAMVKRNFRIYNYPLPWEGRRTGKPAVVRLKLITAIIRSFIQTIAYAHAMKRKANENKCS